MRDLKRALVLGGGGFIGTWLVDVLAREGVLPVALDRQPPQERGTARVETVVGDVAETDLVSLIEGNEIDAVFHLVGTGSVPDALERPAEDLERNAGTTLAVLEALRRLERPPVLVFVSSAAVYGEGRRLPIDESHPLEPVSPYGISKLAAEHYLRLYVRLYGLPALVVRPFSIYGPRQRKLVVHDLLVRVLAGEDPLEIAASADVTRDFVFVEDAASALLTLARNAPAEGEAYNLASGTPTALPDLVAGLLAAAGSSARFAFTGARRPGDPLHWHGDPARAQSLGVVLSTPLGDGLRKTAAWLAASPAPANASPVEIGS